MEEAAPVYPALWVASRDGQTEKVRQLLAEEVDIEEKGGPHASAPLKEASGHGHVVVVLLLLEHGADVSVKNIRGASPLHYATLEGLAETMFLLLHHGADVSATDELGWTPLHHAAVRGRVKVVQLLLEHGADLQLRNSQGQTPEDMATFRSQLEVAAMIKAEEVRREELRMAQCVAFAMGHQERLGTRSWVQELDAGVVRMVLEQV